MPTKPNVIIDTDMAADDWMAILYLLRHPGVNVTAITVTGAGEAHCEPGVRNALGLLELAQYADIPVTCGRETPLQCDHVFPQEWRDGVDSLGGLTLPENNRTPAKSDAVELLTTMLQNAEQKTTILALGPLTNLAEAFEKTPSLVDRIEMLYIMGGAVYVPGNIHTGIVNDYAEWNIYVDPYAAKVVVDSGVPITLVGLDATNDAPISGEFYERMQAGERAPEAEFIYRVIELRLPFIKGGTYYFWDPLAAALITDEDLSTYETVNLDVITEEGEQCGRTIPYAQGKPVRVAMSADRGRFEQLFLDALNHKLS